MEQQILQMMKSLGLTRKEAIELIAEDEAVDKMTVKQAESDLTPEQKRAIKKAKGGARAVNAYGREVKVIRKQDETKRELIQKIAAYLQSGDLPLLAVDVANPEREIKFKLGDENFSLTLVRHRPPKK